MRRVLTYDGYLVACRPAGRTTTFGTALLAAAVLVGCNGGDKPTSFRTVKGWELVWSDEFDGAALDPSKWTIQTGDGTAEGIPGWGNNELQSYQAANVAISGGNLVITAREESTDDGHAYTSGRINTSGKLDITYGRVEASIHAPSGQGLWSAFWMLPTDAAYGTWAASGEIDIMEVFSRDPGPFAQAALHYGMAWPLNTLSYAKYLGVDPADGFHVYALEWDEQEIRWFVDGVHFHTVQRSTYWTYYKDEATNAHISGSDSAPFDQPFHLLVNLAVGGNLPGPPDPAVLPAELRVDYVRVYACNIDIDTGLGCDGFADAISPAVVPPPPGDVYRAVHDLYVDAVGPLLFPGTEDAVPLALEVHDADGALALSEVAGGERGMVIDVHTTGGGSFSIVPANGEAQTFFGMGGASAPGEYAAEVQFDLYVVSDQTDPASSLRVKLDSGFPDVGFVELPLVSLPRDEWTTVTVQIGDIVHNPRSGPVDLGQVLSLFVLEPTGLARLKVDNIRIVCGHVGQGDCGIAPPAPR